MKDERIQNTVNKFAAGGFFLWYVLTLISLNYRLYILKQHPRQFWDFFAIFLIANLFVFIAYASKGAFAHDFKKRWLAIFIVVSIVHFTVFSFIARIPSVFDAGKFLISSLLGVGLIIAVAYFLNQHWKRKEGIEDEV